VIVPQGGKIQSRRQQTRRIAHLMPPKTREPGSSFKQILKQAEAGSGQGKYYCWMYG
jgi:hypothetical protein